MRPQVLELSVTIVIAPGMVVLGPVRKNVGQVARTNVFEVVVRVMMDDDDVDDIEFLGLGGRKFCAPSVRWLY